VAALGIVGALTLLAAGQVSDAEDGLAASKAEGTRLQVQTNEYAEVPEVYAQVEAAEAQVSAAMGKEVRWSYFLNDVSLKVPGKVWLTSMTVAQDVDSAVADATANPTAPGSGTYLDAGLGTVTFAGSGYRHNDVAAWLDALAKQKGLAQPYFTSSSKELIGDESSVNFTSQATITDEALSGRYSQKAGS
jgi:Tfp pilus assembly protein PilN